MSFTIYSWSVPKESGVRLHQPLERLIKIGVTSVLLVGCSDAEISIPNETSGVLYDLRWEEGDLRFDDFELVLLHEPFSVPQLWENLPQNYPGLYNGCYRYEWVDEGHSTMFGFVNWMEKGGSLVVDVNPFPDDDWTLVLTNRDGGRIEAEMSGTGADGVNRRIGLSAVAPKSSDGELCTGNLVGAD